MLRNLRTASAYRLTFMAFVLVLVFCAGVSFAQPDWTQWSYYVDVNVNNGQYARTATPVELQINFTNYLNGATLDTNSVRVAEFADASRTGTPIEVYSQFDTGSEFDATTNAAGEVVWILRGIPTDPNALSGAVETPAGTPRYYRVYFDDINHSKGAPGYVTDLTTADLTGTYPIIENSAYKATLYRTRDTVWKFQNKLTDTDAMMWDATSTTWDNVGMYYAVTVYNNIPVDQYYSTSLPYQAVSANKAIRVTYATRKRVLKNSVYYNFETVRKFYSGVPYFKEVTKFTSESGTNVWHSFQLRWNDTNARTRVIDNTEVNPLDATVNMPLAKVYDYDAAGVNGGIGHLFAADTMPKTIAENVANKMWCALFVYDQAGRWRYKEPWTPVYLNHALMVHNGTDQATSEAAVDKCLADYGCPVQMMIANTGSVTGKLTDTSNSSRTVKGALVRLWINDTYIGKTYSSSVGGYTFANVPAGDAKISVKCDGYDTEVVTGETVAAGEVTTKNISLQPIIFAGKFMRLEAPADGTWKFIKHVDLLTVNANLVTTTLEEIQAFAGPTIDSSIPVSDISVPNITGTGWDDLQSADNIYGWYRTIINIPTDWASGRSLILRDFMVDDAVEVYFNGVKVGSASVFGGASWHGKPCNFVIPSNIVDKNGANVLAIKLFDGTGGGGIYAGGPVLEMAPATAEVTFEVKGPNVLGGPNLPIQGATVTIAEKTAVTGADGKCTFYAIPADFYTATVNHPSYWTKTLTDVELPEIGTEEILVEYDSFFCTVTGTITQNNVALPNARVYLECNGSFLSATTNASGVYSITGITPSETDGQITANALNSVPVIGETVDLDTAVVTKNFVLTYKETPVYDDFSGESLDMSKWEFYNTDPTDPPPGDSTATLNNGILELVPARVRGGILSKIAFPNTYGTYEVVFPQRYAGAYSENQGFAIINPATGYGYGVRLENQNWFTKIFITGNADWQITSPTFPVRHSILRTGNYYDIYVNGVWNTYLGQLPINSATGQPYLADGAYIYLNGYQNGTLTAYFDEVRAGSAIDVTPATLSDVKSADEGSNVGISDVIVTASFSDAFWVENADRSAGIKVISRYKPAVGKKVYVTGSVVKSNREVAVQAFGVVPGTDEAVPPPVAVTGKVAAEFDKLGAAAQGLYVKVAGIVTGVYYESSAITGYFLDDGSGLVGDGTNKGLFVAVDSTSGTTESIIGTFVTVKGPLTVKEVGGNILPAVREIPEAPETPASFTAYNDCAWSTGQLDTNITQYGIGTGFSGSTSGLLKDYGSGAQMSITATFTQSGDVAWSVDYGTNCTLGTDADSVFGGKVDLLGYISYGTTGWYVDLTFSGLDLSKTYEFTTTANRAGGYTDRRTKYTISGAQSFVNASSNGEGVLMNIGGLWVSFNTGENTSTGYVAKWTDIQPSTNGTFTIRAEAESGTNAYAFGAFMLKVLSSTP